MEQHEKLSVNDSCRFCSVTLRLNGTISNSRLIFDSKDKDNVCGQLSKLGLVIENTAFRSYRVCRRCSATITRLVRDTEVLQKWKNAEREIEIEIKAETETDTCPGEDDSSADERNGGHMEPRPSEAPRPAKRSRKSTVMPSRSSVTKVVITYDKQNEQTLTCQSDTAGIVENLAKRKFARAANLMTRHRELVEHLKASVLDVVEADCVALCNQQNQFMLWRTSAEELQSFSFQELHGDLKRLSPFLFSILSKITNDSLPHICAAASVALRGRENRLAALSYYINSVLLCGGGPNKKVFQQLAKLGITTTKDNAVSKQQEMANYWTAPLNHIEDPPSLSPKHITDDS